MSYHVPLDPVSPLYISAPCRRDQTRHPHCWAGENPPLHPQALRHVPCRDHNEPLPSILSPRYQHKLAHRVQAAPYDRLNLPLRLLLGDHPVRGNPSLGVSMRSCVEGIPTAMLSRVRSRHLGLLVLARNEPRKRLRNSRSCPIPTLEMKDPMKRAGEMYIHSLRG